MKKPLVPSSWGRHLNGDEQPDGDGKHLDITWTRATSTASRPHGGVASVSLVALAHAVRRPVG